MEYPGNGIWNIDGIEIDSNFESGNLGSNFIIIWILFQFYKKKNFQIFQKFFKNSLKFFKNFFFIFY